MCKWYLYIEKIYCGRLRINYSTDGAKGFLAKQSKCIVFSYTPPWEKIFISIEYQCILLVIWKWCCPFVKNIHLVAETHSCSFDSVVNWCVHFTIKQWINSDFRFHSRFLTSDKTAALLKKQKCTKTVISGRFTFSAKCSHQGDQTRISGESEGTWTKRVFPIDLC